ncbi:MAG: haloacid dehalogenase-like hydrolase [Candidatus Diapherotrites archaeon]|uniref:Haloacid dehalogenase-like hydrolase n=1 Tax=Candidatus Iainarchaeum sp. TaxID=3101447 RepID=A0A8T3YIF2_9ARCH|nr:haloacid dehalogenase-like hydrolase [Candidatus Diapherotrites archaeon]
MAIRIPRLKVPRAIRSKLSAAKLLGTVMKNSIQFKLRRGAFRKRYKSREFDTIIVDMDGTLFRGDANLEGLKFLYPDKNEGRKTYGEEIYDSLISKIASGEYSIERAILEGNKFLMAKKASVKSLSGVLSIMKGEIRVPLVRSLKKAKRRGMTIVLATLSSRTFGELANSYIAEKYGFGFDMVLGTELSFDSQKAITGVKSIVGTKDFDFGGIPVHSKLTAIRHGMAAGGKEFFDLKKAVLITDSYGDIDLAKMLVTILIKPENPTAAQKVSQRLRLADYIIRDDSDLQRNLESILLGPVK